jgi:hypothetical protein
MFVDAVGNDRAFKTGIVSRSVKTVLGTAIPLSFPAVLALIMASPDWSYAMKDAIG